MFCNASFLEVTGILGRGVIEQPATSVAPVLWDEFVLLHKAPDHARGSTLEDLYQAIQQLPEPRSALCLSGGGIRSASFALGVIQALAKRKLLQRFTYLSTVSGGRYIGSWLTACRL